MVADNNINCSVLTLNDSIHFNKFDFNNNIGLTDWARIRLSDMDGSGNSGELEIAVTDDSTEEIVCRQYKGNGNVEDRYWTDVKRTLKLLDAYGDTDIPGRLFVHANDGGYAITMRSSSATNGFVRLTFEDTETTNLGIIGYGKASTDPYIYIKLNDASATYSCYRDMHEFINAPVVIKDDLQCDGNLTVTGTINGYKIASDHNSGSYYYQNIPIIPLVRVDGCMEVGQYIDFHHKDSPAKDMDARLAVTKDSNGNSTLNIESCQLHADKSLTVTGTITAGSRFITNSRLRLTDGAQYNMVELANVNGGTLIAALCNPDGSEIRRTALFNGSQTITHVTNAAGEIGTFCESNGEIYDGYEKIEQTDCICQVQQSTSLNKKIVGIITTENEFASHGDCLVKVNSIEGLEVGDILAPDENGCGRKATDEEELFMMRKAIPRPKITSFNTGIDGMVACFIV